MNWKSVSVAMALGAALAGGNVHADDNFYEGGALAHYFFPSSHRDMVEQGAGVGLDLIRFWNRHEGISLRVNYTNLETDLGGATPSATDFWRYAVAAGYWRYLDGDGLELPWGLRAFTNANIGVARQESPRNNVGKDDNGLAIEAAIGTVSTWDVLVPDLKWRTEIRFDWEDHFDGSLDTQIATGVHYTFGKVRPRARAVEPAPAPKPAPKPEPVVAPPPPPPPPVEPPKPEPREVMSRFEIYFASGSSTVGPQGRGRLDQAIEATKGANVSHVELVAHTDSTGSIELNRRLSAARAKSVYDYVVGKGYPADKIKQVPAGPSRPVATNDTAEGRGRNRRVDVEIIAIQQ